MSDFTRDLDSDETPTAFLPAPALGPARAFRPFLAGLCCLTRSSWSEMSPRVEGQEEVGTQGSIEAGLEGTGSRSRARSGSPDNASLLHGFQGQRAEFVSARHEGCRWTFVD